MGQLLTVSRAAQLVGVSRSAMQKKIREAELPSHDGMVDGADLLRVYPEFSIEESGAFERVSRIKEQSFGRRVQERMLPSAEVLAQRLFAQGQELADLRRHLRRYHDLVVGLRRQLSEFGQDDPATMSERIAAALDRGLAEVLGSDDPPDRLAVLDDILRVMTAHVTVRPSGREFFVEGHDTLLVAGIRSGLTLNYGCGNGNCGLCKARLVSGEVRQVQHCDYAFTESERQQGHILMCSCTAISDVVLEALEAEGPADIAEQRIVARVKSLAPFSAQCSDTLLLHLQTPRSNRLRFLAGQSVRLGLTEGGRDAGGVYPVASCPCDDRNLLFHIIRPSPGDGDAFAERLFAAGLPAGEPVSVWGPWGDFVLRQNPASGRTMMFLACDDGFAPVKSLIEHALAVEAAESLALCWAATRSDGQYQANLCRSWEEALDEFSYVPLSAGDADAAGRAAAQAACAGRASLRGAEIYVAGPAAFVAAAMAELSDAGATPDQLVSTVT